MTAKLMILLTAMVVYLIGVILIGALYSRHNHSAEDFYLGGRKLGPFVVAMSAEASDMSAYLLMGLPGVALLAGLPEATWTAIGLAIGTYLNWLLVARRLRIYSQQVGAVTVPDFFSRRYGDGKHRLSLAAAVVIIIFFIPYTASGFNACGTLFSSLFGVDYFTAMLVSAIVIVLYTTIGGFLAVSMSDLIQSVVMTIALIIVVFFGIQTAGGWSAVAENCRSMAGYLDLMKGYDYLTGTAGTYGPIVIVSTLAWGLGYFGMPHILVRFMAIEKPEELRLSRRVATVWVVISMGVAVLIGIVGNAMISAGAIDALSSENAQRIIIKIAELIADCGLLPAIVAGVILSGILAATMSTADSQLLSAASAVSQDLLQGTLGLRLSEKSSMLVARLTVVAIAAIAVVWASSEGVVFAIVSFAWAGFGAAFGPAMLLALFWRRSNQYGALAGMIAGGGMVFVWKYLIAPLGGVFDIYELLPAFLFAIVVNAVVSLLTPAPAEEVLQQFDGVD